MTIQPHRREALLTGPVEPVLARVLAVDADEDPGDAADGETEGDETEQHLQPRARAGRQTRRGWVFRPGAHSACFNAGVTLNNVLEGLLSKNKQQSGSQNPMQQSKGFLATKSLFSFHSSKWYIYFLKLNMVCFVSPWQSQ